MADKIVWTITQEEKSGCLIMLVPMIGAFVALAAGVVSLIA